MTFSIKKGFRQFLIRLGIFAIILYLIVPAIINFFAKNKQLAFIYRGDYIDIFIISVVITFTLLKRQELLKIKPYKNNIIETSIFTIISGLFFYLLYYNKYLINLSYLATHSRTVIMFTFLFYILGIIFLGLAIFNMKIFYKFFNSIISSIGILIVYICSILILNSHWRFFANLIAKGSAFLLRLTFNNVILDLSKTDPLLGAEQFSVIIGSPCSGITSLSMFIGLFLLITIIDYNKLIKNKIFPYLTAGIIGMFAVATLRVYALMVVGIKISPEYALNAFHNNAGWIFFITYLIIFWYFVYPKLFKKANKKPKTIKTAKKKTKNRRKKSNSKARKK
ncbi:MAG: archaeosortase/exosortase family protein [Nanoarchaeota archaeon]|nr:archaeosortase/exosortase family protein [Nanoarchaeota archaeon]